MSNLRKVSTWPLRSDVTRRWTDLEIAQLGILTDSEVARRRGITVDTVKQYRRALGIKSTHAPASRTSTAGEKERTSVVRRSAGRPARNWTPEADALMGQVPDRDVATRLGCPENTVSARRRLLGIAPCRLHREPERTRAKRSPPGTDHDIASFYRNRRKQLGIER